MKLVLMPKTDILAIVDLHDLHDVLCDLQADPDRPYDKSEQNLASRYLIDTLRVLFECRQHQQSRSKEQDQQGYIHGEHDDVEVPQ